MVEQLVSGIMGGRTPSDVDLERPSSRNSIDSYDFASFANDCEGMKSPSDFEDDVCGDAREGSVTAVELPEWESVFGQEEVVPPKMPSSSGPNRQASTVNECMLSAGLNAAAASRNHGANPRNKRTLVTQDMQDEQSSNESKVSRKNLKKNASTILGGTRSRRALPPWGHHVREMRAAEICGSNPTPGPPEQASDPDEFLAADVDFEPTRLLVDPIPQAGRAPSYTSQGPENEKWSNRPPYVDERNFERAPAVNEADPSVSRLYAQRIERGHSSYSQNSAVLERTSPPYHACNRGYATPFNEAHVAYSSNSPSLPVRYPPARMGTSPSNLAAPRHGYPEHSHPYSPASGEAYQHGVVHTSPRPAVDYPNLPFSVGSRGRDFVPPVLAEKQTSRFPHEQNSFRFPAPILIPPAGMGGHDSTCQARNFVFPQSRCVEVAQPDGTFRKFQLMYAAVKVPHDKAKEYLAEMKLASENLLRRSS